MDTKWRAEATAEIGLIQLWKYFKGGRKNQSDFDAAVQTLTSVRSQFPGQGDAASRGEIRLARYYLETARDPAKAAAMLRTVIASYPDCANIVEAKYHLATCARAEGDARGCIEQCKAILAQYPKSEWCDYIMYYQGCCEWAAGTKEEALATLGRVVEAYPSSQWATAAKSTLAKMTPLSQTGGK